MLVGERWKSPAARFTKIVSMPVIWLPVPADVTETSSKIEKRVVQPCPVIGWPLLYAKMLLVTSTVLSQLRAAPSEGTAVVLISVLNRIVLPGRSEPTEI